jgi:hypothetical protein
MKKLLVVAVILLGFSTIAMAQDFSRAEVLGAYTVTRCDNSFFGAPGSTCTYNGWKASVAINGNKWLGFVADVGGSLGPNDTRDFYTFLVGPRVTIRKGRTSTFLQGLFGDARVSPGLYFSYDNDFAMGLGGGLDISAGDKLSVRPIQIEYLGIKTEHPIADNVRFSFGVIYKLGQVK